MQRAGAVAVVGVAHVVAQLDQLVGVLIGAGHTAG